MQSVSGNATNATTDCTDYNYYMNLTLAEKFARLEELYCGPLGLTASDAMVRKLEALADTNNNGVLSCEEFNSAYFKNETILLDSFCRDKTNVTFTTVPAVAPAGQMLKTSAAVMEI
jgi:hypothetical protein